VITSVCMEHHTEPDDSSLNVQGRDPDLLASVQRLRAFTVPRICPQLFVRCARVNSKQRHSGTDFRRGQAAIIYAFVRAGG
jgi:hypothetical protein